MKFYPALFVATILIPLPQSAHAIYFSPFCQFHIGNSTDTSIKLPPDVDFALRADSSKNNSLIERTQKEDDLTVKVLGHRRRVRFLPETEENKTLYNRNDSGEPTDTYFYSFELDLSPSETSPLHIKALFDSLQSAAGPTGFPRDAIEYRYDRDREFMIFTFQHVPAELNGGPYSQIRATPQTVLKSILTIWDLHVGYVHARENRAFREGNLWALSSLDVLSRSLFINESGKKRPYKISWVNVTGMLGPTTRIEILLPKTQESAWSFLSNDIPVSSPDFILEKIFLQAPHGLVRAHTRAPGGTMRLQEYLDFFASQGVQFHLPSKSQPQLLWIEFPWSANPRADSFQTLWKLFLKGWLSRQG